jgi:hypothetical protein
MSGVLTESKKMEHWNPAEQISQIIQAAYQQNRGESIRAVWSKLLGADPRNPYDVYARLNDFINLVESTKLHIKAMPNINQDLYLEPLTNIEQTYRVYNLQASWESVMNCLSPETTTGLKFLVELFSQNSKEGLIEAPVLDELRQEVETLIALIIETELELEVKAFLLDKLEIMRTAILHYRLSGSQGLKNAAESMIGAAFLHRVAIENECKDSKRDEIIKNALGLVARVVEVVSATMTIASLSGVDIPRLLK